MTRITETKSVKVDNWGVFFLQKLQNFFNKTDHCDLTLQFNDNSQLKVHRLVLSACTDYFNMLEGTCEMYDDVLIMPLDLQADVIVPIVNFMYTGTLEFQYSIYEKLLKTAKDMNMTVLLKLLEAHKQTTRLIQGGRQPVVLNKQAPTRARPNVTYQMPANVSRSYNSIRQAAPTRAGSSPQKSVTMVKHQTTISPVKAPIPEHRKYGASTAKAGPSRFDASVPDTLEGNFDDISYESQPLVTADQIKKEEETSPFEKLRKGYTNVVKRPAPASFAQPAAKKPNLDEVKEFTEAARLRSQLAAEDDDSPGFADDTHFDDDEEEELQQTAPVKQSPGVAKQIVIKQEAKTSPSMAVKQITVKDESGSVDHAKIISEVLKKYPHLVKKNKNIKLKIMQKTSPSAAHAAGSSAAPMKMEVRTATPLKADISMIRKATEAARQPAAAASTPTAGPKKIDSKTMHALIAKGAENMTGPWLCLRCGIDGRPISIPSYKAFRNHLIVKHKEKIDARICEHCGWRAEMRNPNLFYHWLTEHNIKSTVKFPTCSECGHVAMNASQLQKHEEENHQRGDLQQCIYCNKVFEKEMDLYEHMKSLHKERAREDGVIDFSDEEYEIETEEAVSVSNTSSSDNKIKILSNISIGNSSIPFVIDPRQAQTVSQIGGKSQIQLQQVTLEPSSEAEALSNVATGIATSLGLVEDPNFQGQYIEHQMATVHGETGTTTTVTAASGPDQLTKLITEDGTELQLTQSQKEEIFSQLQNSENGGNVVMVLNDDQFLSGAEIQLEDGTQLISTGSAVPAATATDQNNIVVMYSQAGDELATTTSTTTTTTAAAASKTSPTAADDETSQASTQPSEKGTTVSEKETDHDEEDSQMEVDPESSQEELDKNKSVATEDEEDEDSKHDDDEKAAKEREKQKLISELEGDWSEDTEEQPITATTSTTTTTTSTSTISTTSSTPAVAAATPAAKEKKPDAKPKEAEVTSTKTVEASVKKEKVTPVKKEEVVTPKKEEGISDLLDDWENEGKSMESSEVDADLEKKLEKVVGGGEKDEEKVEPQEEEPAAPAEETSTADQTTDSVDEGSLNDSTTQIVIMAAESETETSTRDEADADESQKEGEEEEKEAEETAETAADVTAESEKETPTKEESETVVEKKEKTDEEVKDEVEDEEVKDEEEDKSKSKEVVSSLLGDWDEDDDL